MEQNLPLHFVAFLSTVFGVTLIAALLGRRVGGTAVLLCVMAVATAVFATTHYVLNDWPWDQFATAILNRAVVASVALAVVLAGVSLDRVPRFVRWLVALIAPGLFLMFVLLHREPGMSRQQFFLESAAPVAAAVAAGWVLLEPLTVKAPPAVVPVLLTLVGTGLSFFMVTTPETNAAQLSPVVTTTIAGAAVAAIVAAIFRKKISFSRGPVLWWLTMLATLVAYPWITSTYLRPIPLSLIAAAIPLAWVVQFPPLRKLKPWKRELLRFALTAIPVGIAVGLILVEIHSKKDEY